MIWKLFKKDECPSCGTRLEVLNPKKSTLLVILEELMLFGGLGLYIFGSSYVAILGGILLIAWLIMVLMFIFILKPKLVCPECGYKTTEDGAKNNA